MKLELARCLRSLTLAAAMVIAVTGCAGGSDGSITLSDPETGAAADEQLSTSTAAPPLPTMDHAPVISVTAGDDTCVATARTVAAGRYAIIVHNSGDQFTGVFLYGAGDTILAEIEDVDPSTEKELDDVTLPAGGYEFACNPGPTGPGKRVPLTVTG